MNDKIDYKVEDFLRDDEFICYALNISSEANKKWDSLLKKYSSLAKEAEKAIAILNGEDITHTLETEENEKLKKSIFASLSLSL